MKRRLHLLAGFSCVGLGIAGALLPILPSTCFFIFAAYFFGQSSEKLENWILSHPRMGPAVTQWRATRSIPMLGKLLATLGMMTSLIIMFMGGAPKLVLGVGALVILGSAAYIWTRPTLKIPAAKNCRPTPL
ncbi:MAG: YbaN family protein [Bdellovibrio sp.]